MLGENHSLIHEFPEMETTIQNLASSDSTFAADMKQYNSLDKEIRVLELRGGPIADEAMNQLKHNRAELKDSLYKRVIAVK
ncbi:YdcH family protein [Vibrio sp. LaRot3]|uniref:YdcH family protein n=1 Tax=Vibrio sp. LaRot3 TaxID=2998829 RepID=UPI0022CE3228|nr:YdcH family protein [Vibrio sp. LaRot3]MDA0148241.1 YdcH family protein [Vibrio sp. LaRot3]